MERSFSEVLSVQEGILCMEGSYWTKELKRGIFLGGYERRWKRQDGKGERKEGWWKGNFLEFCIYVHGEKNEME